MITLFTGHLPKITGSAALLCSFTGGTEEPSWSAAWAARECRRCESRTRHSWREGTFPKWYKFYIGTNAYFNDRRKVQKTSQRLAKPKSHARNTGKSHLQSGTAGAPTPPRRGTSEASEGEGGAAGPGAVELLPGEVGSEAGGHVMASPSQAEHLSPLWRVEEAESEPRVRAEGTPAWSTCSRSCSRQTALGGENAQTRGGLGKMLCCTEGGVLTGAEQGDPGLWTQSRVCSSRRRSRGPWPGTHDRALGWSSPCCGQQCTTGNDPWAWMRVPQGGPEGEGRVNPRGAPEPRLLSSRIAIIKRYIRQTLIKPHRNKGLSSALVSM